MKKYIAIVAFILGAAGYGAPAHAVVEYVKVCDTYGAGYYYVPGTSMCLNPLTGETRLTTIDGVVQGRSELAKMVDRANNRANLAMQGTALAMALPNPFVQPGHTFAIAGNFATFEQTGALGFGAAYKMNENLTLTAGGSFSTGTVAGSGHGVAARAGFNLSW